MTATPPWKEWHMMSSARFPLHLSWVDSKDEMELVSPVFFAAVSSEKRFLKFVRLSVKHSSKLGSVCLPMTFCRSSHCYISCTSFIANQASRQRTLHQLQQGIYCTGLSPPSGGGHSTQTQGCSHHTAHPSVSDWSLVWDSSHYPWWGVILSKTCPAQLMWVYA